MMKKRIISIFLSGVILAMSFCIPLSALELPTMGNESFTCGHFLPDDTVAPGRENYNVNLRYLHLPLNGTQFRASYILKLVELLKTCKVEDLDITASVNADFIANSEVLVLRNFSVAGKERNEYYFFTKGTVLDITKSAAVKFGISAYCFIDTVGYPATQGYKSAGFMVGSTMSVGLSSLSESKRKVLYYSGSWSDGVNRNEAGATWTDDGSYVAPVFEFLCFNGDLPAPDGDGFLSVHSFPYLYYKIYSGSDDLSKYSLRIYEDSMFSNENTLRAEISYDEMKGLAKDKTYTYVQSIHTYIPIGRNMKYWLQIYNRTTGQVVYELPVKTSGMTNQTPNIEHVHYWRVEDGNTVGDPTAYNDTGYFGGEDIVGPYEPDLPPGTSWENGGGNGGLPIDWTNLGELNDWFKTVGNYGSEFIGYLSSVFSFIPPAIWSLIGLAIAVAILMRVFGR